MQVTSRFILFGTTGGGVSAQNLPATNTATNYTPTAVASEPTTEVSAHLNGINTALVKLLSLEISLLLLSLPPHLKLMLR